MSLVWDAPITCLRGGWDFIPNPPDFISLPRDDPKKALRLNEQRKSLASTKHEMSPWQFSRLFSRAQQFLSRLRRKDRKIMKFYANLHLFRLLWQGINYGCLLRPKFPLFFGFETLRPEKRNINCNIKVLRGKRKNTPINFLLRFLPFQSKMFPHVIFIFLSKNPRNERIERKEKFFRANE